MASSAPPGSTGPELTVRAVLVGCLLGAILAAGNVYMALKTGMGDAGFIASALLGFALFAALRPLGARPYAALENNITQTVASSAGQAVFTASLVGGFPALAMLGRQYPAWLLGLWGFSLAILGIFAGLALRERLIVAERLPFPTGGATASVIEALQASRAALRRAHVLVTSGGLSMAVVWFRDGRPAWIPQSVGLFGSRLGISLSPMLIGAGMLIGVRVGLSLLLGTILAWIVLVPVIVHRHLAPASSYEALASWLMWPGVSILIAASMTSLLLDWRVFARALGDLRRLGVRGSSASSARTFGLILAALAVGIILLLAWWKFHMSLVAIVVALALSLVLALVCGRATGETDIAPITQMGQLTQALFTLLFPGQFAVGVLASTVPAGNASHTASSLWSLKAGHQLGSNPWRQGLAQVIGAAIGMAIAVPTYWLLVRAYGIGTESLPAPAAATSKAIAELARVGSSAMPPAATVASAVAALVGVALALLERTRVRRWVPSAVAMSVAFLVPAPFCVTLCLGALGMAVLQARWRTWCDAYATPLAAGCIAGEALMGAAIGALIATGALGR